MSQQASSSKKRALILRRGVAGCVPVAAAMLFLLTLGVITAALWIYFVSPQTHIAAGTQVQVRIAPGASTRAIASQLLGAGVIANANGFALRSRLSGADGRLQPGPYELSTGMTDAQVIRVLTAGPNIDMITVTIPEGFRLEQIAERLDKEAGMPADKFLALARHGAPKFAGRHPFLLGAYKGSLEGYLFPKTYELRRGMTAEQVIDTMLGQFDTEIQSIDLSVTRQRGASLAQLVVIASMIERESKLSSERPLVASVIYNRLARGMRLKIDATIEYVLQSNKFRLTNADLYTKTPYNTYLYPGLPPGPICNPGLESLRAAAAPADTAFIYYVLTGKDGSHTFTTNLADFLVAKRKSKEVFGR